MAISYELKRAINNALADGDVDTAASLLAEDARDKLREELMVMLHNEIVRIEILRTRRETGRRIEFARKEKKLSLRWLAEKAEISTTQLRHYELGTRDVPSDRLTLIADALEKDRSYFNLSIDHGL